MSEETNNNPAPTRKVKKKKNPAPARRVKKNFKVVKKFNFKKLEAELDDVIDVVRAFPVELRGQVLTEAGLTDELKQKLEVLII